MFRKIQRRFILIAMAAFSAVMLVLMIGINLMNEYQMRISQKETMDGILEYDEMTASIPEDQRQPINEMPWAGDADGEFTTRFFLVHCDEDGNITIFGNDYISSIDEETARAYTKTVLGRKKSEGRYGDYSYEISENEEDIVIVFLNISREMQFGRTLLLVSVLTGIVSLLVALIIILLLSRPAILPFVKNSEQQKRFITDASHELKTPITSIATSADILAMEYEEDEWVQSIQHQSGRLTHLVNDLVTLSRLDEEVPFPEKKIFSLSNTAWEIAEPFVSQAKARGKTLQLQIEDGVMLNGEETSVSKMLSILLDNAIRYSANPAGTSGTVGGNGNICLFLGRRHRKVILEVTNTCQLPASLDLNRLFDRFYRPDESRSTHTGGSGIGLSIARKVAETHGGTITAVSPDRRSITFRVTLPGLPVKTGPL